MAALEAVSLDSVPPVWPRFPSCSPYFFKWPRSCFPHVVPVPKRCPQPLPDKSWSPFWSQPTCPLLREAFLYDPDVFGSSPACGAHVLQHLTLFHSRQTLLTLHGLLVPVYTVHLLSPILNSGKTRPFVSIVTGCDASLVPGTNRHCMHFKCHP